MVAGTSFTAFGSFGTDRGVIAFGGVGIDLLDDEILLGDWLTLFRDCARDRDNEWLLGCAGFGEATELFFESTFSLLGILLTRANFLDRAAALDESLGTSSFVRRSSVLFKSTRLLRTAGPVLRARSLVEGDTDPDKNISTYTQHMRTN